MTELMPDAGPERERVEDLCERSDTWEIAEVARRAREALIGNLSYELRTPLTLILSPLDALLAHAHLPPQIARSLSLVRRNAGRLAHLVDAMLDLQKLEAHDLELRWSAVRVLDVCRDVLADAEPAAEARGIRLTLSADEDVGAAPLDRHLFEKIVVTLVSNALKFTSPGGRVSVELRSDGDRFELAVSDTGIGIPEDKLRLLFRPFQQLDASSTRRYEGSGLGLALVKEQAERMGGAVTVESRAGEGSRFRVRLPRDPDRVAALLRAQHDAHLEAAVLRTMAQFDDVPVPSQPPPPLSGLKPRLILAENNADMRDHVTELLSREYDVIAVEDGRAALSAARACPPDVVVSDVMLPELDGMALLRALKQDEALRDVPVVLLTARVESLAPALDGGADDFIAKPFSPVELSARLRAARRLHKLRQQLLLTVAELSETRADLSVASRRAPISARTELCARMAGPLAALASALRARPGQEDLAEEVESLVGMLASPVESRAG